MLNLNNQYCVAITQKGKRCSKKAVKGYRYCALHSDNRRINLELRHSFAYRKEIWCALEEFKRDGQLDSMDAEIAYLQTVLNRIEEDEDLNSAKKWELITNTLDRITALKERRRKHLIECNYMLTLEAFRLFMAQVYAILKDKLKDENLLREIGIELSKIKVKALEMRKNATT
jgi:hypothetical protein